MRRSGGLLAAALLIGAFSTAQARQVSLLGFVSDGSSGRPIELANVLVAQGDRLIGGTTDEEGRYRITDLSEGTWVLRVSFVGFQTFADTLALVDGESRTVNVRLQPGEQALGEVVVASERTSGAARVTAGRQTLTPQDVELIPSPDLSADLVTALTSQPGVVSLGDRGGQLFLRGGEPTQNLVQLDGVLLYQPFHILGFFSAFPSDIVRRADVYAGGFGARYGERVSSVLDISTRNANLFRREGAATLSPFSIGLVLEQPLAEGKASALLSARRSLVRTGASGLVDQDLPFTFGDVFAKVHAVLNPNARGELFALHTFDRGGLNPTGSAAAREVAWRNTALSSRLLVIPRQLPVTADARVSWSRLQSEQRADAAEVRRADVENLHFAIDGVFYGRSDVAWGASVRTVRLSSELGGQFQNIEVRNRTLEHAGVYLEPRIRPSRGLRIEPGIRAQFFDIRFSPFLEPRLRAAWQVGPVEFSAAGGIYYQAVLGLSDRRDAASVFTVWTHTPGPSDLTGDVRAGRAQRAKHAIAGVRLDAGSGIEVAIEGYVRKLDNLFIAEWTAFPRFTTRLQPATGRTSGFDIRGEVRRGAFQLYGTYGYAATRYEAEQSSLLLWYGTERLAFHPPHDRRHQANLLAALRKPRWQLSARWQFGSGLPFSRAVGFDGFALVDDVRNAGDFEGSRRVIYADPFGARLPTYHRLDLSAERTFRLEGWDLIVQASLINAYDRRNLFFLDVFTLDRVDQLPRVPSLGIRAEFGGER
ncbi:MAG: TonB-dependent receptor [Rhodothermales bacterium]|nr:TonB-dependent receptor [Rhodothermales bacterium]MBO6779960.1 TonB-dependent receptor [Rhodothermales bacterium]